MEASDSCRNYECIQLHKCSSIFLSAAVGVASVIFVFAKSAKVSFEEFPLSVH